MPAPLEELPRRTQDAAMEVEETDRIVVPAVEGRGASSEARSVALSVCKVSDTVPLQLLGLTMG